MKLFRKVTLYCMLSSLVAGLSSASQLEPDRPNQNMSFSPTDGGTAAPYPEQNPKSFVYPGIVRYEGGEAGGDHLIGVGRTVGVLVEIQTNNNESFALKTESLQQAVQDLFQDYRINTSQAPPYLPFFYVVVVVLPIPQGYAAYVSGRLFEKVQLRELQFDSSITWQAITWEKEVFLVVEAQNLERDIQNNVMEISKAFLNRLAFFESLPQQEISKYNPTVQTGSGTSVPRIKESDVKVAPYKPLPKDLKKQKEELLKQLR